MSTASEPQLATRISLLHERDMRWVLYRLATGSDAVRADLAACLDAADRREPVSAELEQRRRSVRVMELLTESYEAHARGDLQACDQKITEAIECDASVVSVVRGGMFLGELPRPEEDWAAWIEYVGANREALARAEADEVTA